MIEVPVFNQTGQAIVMYHANQRQGTVRTLARGEVEGSTRKIYRQKGTGNARMGTVRQPVRVGGGHAKQKRPKDWRQAMPKKARRLARNSAILSKIQSKDIRVVDKIALEQPKTKLMAGVFKALGIDRTCLFALDGRDENLLRSARNIDRTTLTTVDQLNAWEILKNRTLLMTRAGFEQLLAGDEAKKQQQLQQKDEDAAAAKA
jgi:large subunit ribosomal protein L4